MAEPVIILDNGSGYLKAGLSNIENPMVSFTEKQILTLPSLIGRTFSGYSEIIGNINLKPIMIGDEVSPVRSLLDLTYPIQEGIKKCTDDIYILWDYCIKKLGFGYFNIEPQPKLALFCEGKCTGIVLDSGDNFTNCVPIAYNYILHHQTKTLDIAGRHITDYLIRLLQLKGYESNQIVDFEFARQFKEKYCFVSCDINSDRKFDKETTYYNSIHKLPDGRKIKISGEKFEAPEILFKPYYIQNESCGIHEMLYNSINVNIYFI